MVMFTDCMLALYYMLTFMSTESDISLKLHKLYPTLVQVSCMGVDEWLMMCKKVKALSDRFPADWEPAASDEDCSGKLSETRGPFLNPISPQLQQQVGGSANRPKQAQQQAGRSRWAGRQRPCKAALQRPVPVSRNLSLSRQQWKGEQQPQKRWLAWLLQAQTPSATAVTAMQQLLNQFTTYQYLLNICKLVNSANTDML